MRTKVYCVLGYEDFFIVYDETMLLNEYRCPSCGKLLFKGLLVDSEVEAKCRGCGEVHVFHGESKEKFLCLVGNCPGRKTSITASKEKNRRVASC